MSLKGREDVQKYVLFAANISAIYVFNLSAQLARHLKTWPVNTSRIYEVIMKVNFLLNNWD